MLPKNGKRQLHSLQLPFYFVSKIYAFFLSIFPITFLIRYH